MPARRTGLSPGACSGSEETFTISANDGARLAAIRFGSRTAVATVVYVHAPLSDRSYFAPVMTEIDRSFGGNIAQLSYHQRGDSISAPPRPGRARMAQLIDDLDAVLARADGRIVMVVHSLAAVQLQEWLYRHRRDEPVVHAIVAIGPVTELPDPAGSFTARPQPAAREAGNRWIAEYAAALHHDNRIRSEADFESARQRLRAYRRCGADLAVIEDLLRAMPTWILAGRSDPVADYRRVEEFATTVWAELVTVDGAGHDLVHAHPRAVARAVVEALEAVYDLTVYGGAW
ncbi:alpha/beta hydrolase [Nocardia salmonicida]|uniref:alpha/beta hydrolase n=1 Tax=Nocardia salmonicida TaxID=53431 RepID=UPI0033FB6E8F